MAIKDYNVVIPQNGAIGAAFAADVAEFWASGNRTAEVDVSTCGVTKACGCIRYAVKRNPDTAGKIAVIQRRGRVFLERLGG